MTAIPTLQQLRAPIVDEQGNLSRDALRLFTEWGTKLQNTIDLVGQIASSAVIQGRTEGIGTTVQRLTSTGAVASTDYVVDGTGSPLTGGKRGFVALNSSNRLASSFRATAVNVSNVPTSASVLSNDGASHTISVASSTNQFAPGGVSYNSGSVDPGAYGSYYINIEDPDFAGGAVIYTFSTDPISQVTDEGTVPIGGITTTGGTPHTGGGNTGGDTPGGSGGRAYTKL